MKRGPTEGRWQLRFDWTAATPPTSVQETGGDTQAANETQRLIYPFAEAPIPLPGEMREAPPPRPRAPPRGRVNAVLPVPKPLAAAIAAGHFGQDEAGKPIRPSNTEVRAITEAHAEKLRNLLHDLRHARDDDRGPLAAAFDHGIADYTESFGERAGEQFRAYIARTACDYLPSPHRSR